jgi:hypothetical protein
MKLYRELTKMNLASASGDVKIQGTVAVAAAAAYAALFALTLS